MKLRPLLLTICLILLLTQGIGLAWEREVQLLVKELKVFPVNELKRVAVGDPAVADVTVLSDKELMLVAKGVGATSLIIWDAAGQRSFNITVVKQNLDNIAQRVRGLLASSDIVGVRVKAEQDNVYVIGEVLSEQELDKIKDILAPFSNVVNLVRLTERQPLVEIDVNVLEVAYEDLKKLGLDWSNSLPVQYTEPSGARTPGSAYAPKLHVTGKAPKLWRVFKWDRSTIDARLNFLIEEDKARTLANPKLVTLSGKEASFLVGGEVPFVTVSSGSIVTGGTGTTQVEFKEYGVILKIEPLVNAKNEIRVKIEAEVSDLDLVNAVKIEGFTIPALKKRAAQTEIMLNEEDTIFLAGLIKDEDTKNIERLPWLSKVPILGELFKSTDFRDKRTELVISITPRIIGEKADAEYVTSEMIKQEAMLAARQRPPVYTEESSPLAYYTQLVEDIIVRNIVYPDEAKAENLEGIVKIDLRLLSNGEVKEATVKESSGYSALDGAALLAVKKQVPYPSFPSQISQKELRLILPIVFKNYVKNE